MPDWEKVIKALEHHKETAVCNGCPYAGDDDTAEGYEDRAGHRLREWQEFRDWCETLPESWMITGKLPEPPEPVDDDSD